MNGKLITDRQADGIPLFDCMNDFHRQTHPVFQTGGTEFIFTIVEFKGKTLIPVDVDQSREFQ